MGMIKPSPACLGGDMHPGNEEWDTQGPSKDPALFLAGSWTIGGKKFNLEAFRVRSNLEEDYQELDIHERDLGEGGALVGEFEDIFDRWEDRSHSFADRECHSGFETIILDDEQYVLFVFPRPYPMPA
jgi:hypothetical protein